MARQPDAAPLRPEPAAERTHKLQLSPVVLRLSSSTPVLALRGAAWLTALAQAQWEQVSVVLLPCIPGAEAIERARGAALTGRADAAVHLADELPCQEHDRLELIAVPKRADRRDVLCARGVAFRGLRPGARIGAAGANRLSQLALLRPDLELIPLEEDAVTSLLHVEEGELDGAVLSSAEVSLLKLEQLVSGAFSLAEVVPAAGQGALVLEAENRDCFALRVLQSFDDPGSRFEVFAERAVLRRLHAWPTSSVGVTAESRYGSVSICGVLAPGPGQPLVRCERSGPVAMVEQIAGAVASRLLLSGEAAQPDSAWLLARASR